jgi:DNA-binding transcriptional MerR regulator
MRARKYLNIRELSEATGLSETQLRRLAKDRKIPSFQPGGKGGRLFFPQDAIEKSGQMQPDAEDAGLPLSGRRPTWMTDHT